MNPQNLAREAIAKAASSAVGLVSDHETDLSPKRIVPIVNHGAEIALRVRYADNQTH